MAFVDPLEGLPLCLTPIQITKALGKLHTLNLFLLASQVFHQLNPKGLHPGSRSPQTDSTLLGL